MLRAAYILVGHKIGTACPSAIEVKRVMMYVTPLSVLRSPKKPHAFLTSMSPEDKHLALFGSISLSR